MALFSAELPDSPPRAVAAFVPPEDDFGSVWEDPARDLMRAPLAPVMPPPMRSFSRIPETERSMESSFDIGDDDYEASIDVMPTEYSDLPPELLALAANFAESIHEIANSGSVSPEKLSDLFQEFYVTVQDKSTQIVRRNNMRRTKEVQMMSYEEMSQQKRERQLRDARKALWEELVERKVCEDCYQDVFTFQGSDDEAKDITLASKIASLKVLDVGLDHLGVGEIRESTAELVELLADAGQNLRSLINEHSPKGKLRLLIATHKNVVDVLAGLRSVSGSGADYVLPLMIFCVIQFEPACLASNLAFMQRFRNFKTVNGETAYCLTNYEAVVAFLETVDLTTLRVEQDAEPQPAPPVLAPIATDGPPAPAPASPSPTLSVRAAEKRAGRSVPVVATPLTATAGPLEADEDTYVSPPREPQRFVGITPVPRNRNKRRSFLLSSDLANSAVSTADSGLKSIGSTFENSYRYLFGGRSASTPEPKPVQMRSKADKAHLEQRTQQVLQSSSALISALSEKDRVRAERGESVPPDAASVRSTASVERTVSAERPQTPAQPAAAAEAASPAASPTSPDTDDASTRSLFGNMRSFGRAAALSDSPDARAKTAPPVTRFLRAQSGDELSPADVDELLAEYRRLAEYVRSVAGFEVA
ncbi:uncharacterized protein V1510DRAFT_315430 [Dipodascopsis tothii]|uniref:uncharacterized protein n=1 Tax=Dipodascopsis tothii TaxID=44089 RepID=UPI0034D02180